MLLSFKSPANRYILSKEALEGFEDGLDIYRHLAIFLLKPTTRRSLLAI